MSLALADQLGAVSASWDAGFAKEESNRRAEEVRSAFSEAS